MLIRKLLAVGIIAVACGDHSLAANLYVQHNLVSDIPGLADHIDPCLINPWGIVASDTSPFWVSANRTGLSTLYDGNGDPIPLIVNIPGAANTPPRSSDCGDTALSAGSPSGVVFNGTTSFVLGSSPASFLFSTTQGIIAGWNGAAGKTAVVMADRSATGTVYKGLATATGANGPLLYAADFANAKIDIFDGGMNLLPLSGVFTDPQIPAGFAPFNIQNLNGSLYVEYAQQDAQNHAEDAPGAGNGYVDVYDVNGTLITRLVSSGPLNSPWGVALAPAGFGAFAGALLVANHGDGAINAFDATTGAPLGAFQDATGATIQIPGMWALTFGNGHRASAGATPSGGDANTLYFTAGISGPDTPESHGLLGAFEPPPVIAANGVANAASFSKATAPGAFTAIFGTDLAATARTWTSGDFANTSLPTQLDGVSVTINGKPAYVYYVSPNQIDVIAPADTATVSVPVVVTNNNAASPAVSVSLQTAAPAFFAAGKYAVATHADGTLIGPPGSTGGATPAAVGETIVLYGTGFGPTNPAVDGMVVSTAANLTAAPAVTIGNVPAVVTFAGRTQAGLDQINVTVPAVPAGSNAADFAVGATVGTSQTQTGLFVSVQSGN